MGIFSDENNFDEEILEKYNEICSEADKLVEDECYDKAIEKFKKALSILPDGDWQCQPYAYAGLGECYKERNDYETALKYYYDAYTEDTLDNPYILLSIGICYYELNNWKQAREFLLRAYMVEGTEIFEDEEEYLDVIKDLIE